MFRDEYIRIDLENGRFKKLQRFIGIPISDGWEKLPELHHIAVTKVKMHQTLNSARTIGNSSTISTEKFVVYLMGKHKGQRVEAGKYANAETANELSKKLSEFLDIPIKNYLK